MELKKIDLSKNQAEFTPETPLKPAPTLTPPPTTGGATPSPLLTKPKIIGLVIALILGAAAGFIAKTTPSLANKLGQDVIISTEIPTSGLKEGDVVGVSDTKTFKDSVKGVLDKGGFEGEGSHKLLRPGGPSQTVYLTSSVIDLDEFVGHEVTVWGETFNGLKAGWLMDVGRVKVEKLNAPLPE